MSEQYENPVIATPEGVRLLLRVMPKAGRDEITGVRAGRLVVKICVAPEDGKANAAVIRVLADWLDVAPSSIDLVAGAASRNKTMLVRGISADNVKLQH